jgi:DNA-binding response OmpR family regulator
MRCLIIEDDSDLSETICAALVTHRHDPLAASSAPEGLDLLRLHPVELILLDINLPGGISGYAACEAFKSLRPDVPIILMTGAYGSDADERVGHLLGAAAFLRKPFSIEELLRTIDRAAAGATEAPLASFAFRCEECGAEGRARDLGGETARVRCPNCGSVRTIQREARDAAGTSGVPVAPTTLRRRVLVVDPAEHFRFYLLDLLTEAGHYVVTARDGDAALRLAQTWSPDVVIAELASPRTDGIALCRKVKDDSTLHATRVVVVASDDSDPVRRAAREAGADLFVCKPIRAAEFLTALHALIARP